MSTIPRFLELHRGDGGPIVVSLDQVVSFWTCMGGIPDKRVHSCVVTTSPGTGDGYGYILVTETLEQIRVRIMSMQWGLAPW